MKNFLSFDEFSLNEDRDDIELNVSELFDDNAIIKEIGNTGFAIFEPNKSQVIFAFVDRYDEEIKHSYVVEDMSKDDYEDILEDLTGEKFKFRYENGAKAELKALKEILFDFGYMDKYPTNQLEKLGAYRNDDGTWSSKEDLRLDDYPMVARNGKLLFKFKEVAGLFLCDGIGLTTLEGCPERVGKSFFAGHNKFTSLVGGPKYVGETYNVTDGELESLEGAPIKIGKDFYAQENKITSLVGGPKLVEGGSYDVSYNKLTDLEGCPEKVHFDLNASSNQITTFKGLKQGIDRLNVADNNIKTLHNLPEQMSVLNIRNNKITSLKGAPKRTWGLTGIKETIPEIEREWYKSVTSMDKDNPNPPGYENYHAELFAYVMDKFSEMIKGVKWEGEEEYANIDIKSLLQSEEMIKKFKL